MVVYLNSQPENNEERETAFVERIQSLSSKPRQRTKTTLRDLVVKYYPILKPAHERGNTYEELALIFEEELSVSISSGTLRKYMAYAKKQVSTQIDAIELSSPAPSESRSSKPASQFQPKLKAISPERRKRLLSNTQVDDIESEFETL